MTMRGKLAPANSQRETVMNTKSKLAAALAVLTLAGTFALPTTEAQARHRGWGIAASIAGAAFLGAAIADSEARYADEDIYDRRRCRYERKYDQYGFYIGKGWVCRYY